MILTTASDGSMNQEVELVAASHMEMKCTMRECSLEIPMLKLSLGGGGNWWRGCPGTSTSERRVKDFFSEKHSTFIVGMVLNVGEDTKAGVSA